MRESFELDRKPKNTNKTDKVFLKANVCWFCENGVKNRNVRVKQNRTLIGSYLAAAH